MNHWNDESEIKEQSLISEPAQVYIVHVQQHQNVKLQQ